MSVSWEDAEMMSDDELIAVAIESNPGLEYGRVENGLTFVLQVTRVIKLWRNEECYLAGDSPRGVLNGFPPRRRALDFQQGGRLPDAAGETKRPPGDEKF